MSAPLLSVRQSLNSIFEECRVKTDSINKMIKAAITNKRKLRNESLSHSYQQHSRKSNRREIWYKPNTTQQQQQLSLASDQEDDDKSSSESESSSQGHSGDSDSDSYLDETVRASNAEPSSGVDDGSSHLTKEKKLSTSELTKRFMLNYLNSVGKLFTKVGMESYPDVCSQMLHEFKALLRRCPCPLGKMRLMQINCINIALIDLVWKQQQQQSLSGDELTGFIVRSQQLECAIQLSLDVFALLAKK